MSWGSGAVCNGMLFEITDPAVTPQALAKDTGVAQVDLLHIGVPNAGDDYNATVNGVSVSVTVTTPTPPLRRHWSIN